jgi:hypothetical protein
MGEGIMWNATPMKKYKSDQYSLLSKIHKAGNRLPAL